MAKKKKSNFKGKVNRDAQRQKSAKSSYGYLMLPKGVSVFSPDPGSRVRMDIMPYMVTDENHPDKYEEEQIATAGELWYKRPFKVHRNIGVEDETVVCLTSFGERCPICECRARWIKEGRDKEDTDALRPKQRNLYALVPIGVKGVDEIIHVMDMSQFLFQNLLNEELEEDEEYAAFPDLEEGYTLRVRFDAKKIGKGPEFAEASRIDFEKRKNEYEEDILDEVPNLDDMLKRLSYKELEAKFMEIDDADAADDDLDDGDEEEKPRRERKSLKRKEEEDEEEEKPVKRTRQKPKPKPEPEEEDGDKEEEKPKEKSKKSSKKSTGKERCPHGHRFGVDADEKDECAECEIWGECLDEKEGK